MERNLCCPRCGTCRSSREEMEIDRPTTINDAGDVVADWWVPPEMLDGWVAVGAFDVCADCATKQETWAANGDCVRCGRERYDDDGEDAVDGWTHNYTVCASCSTPEDERRNILDFLEFTARSAEDQRHEGHSLPPDLFSTAVEVMLQRAVPNRLHYQHPVDPLAEEHEPWDRMPENFWPELVRCKNLLLEEGGSSPEFQRLAEATIREYAAELRSQGAEV